MKVDLHSEVKVKPCPLCCSVAFLHKDISSGRKEFFWVKCSDLECGCTINAAKDQAEALRRWNQRW